jgi:methylaspartate mutase sigma subunit
VRSAGESGAALAPARRGRTVVISSVASDAHTWNLVFLQLLIEELGYTVVNLGPCVPDDVLIDECRRIAPDLVVISSVNGHGRQGGLRLIKAFRAEEDLADIPVVIGGKLGIAGIESAARTAELAEAGFDAVFRDGAQEVESFRDFAATLSMRTAP